MDRWVEAEWGVLYSGCVCEQPIGDYQTEVRMRIRGRAEAVHEGVPAARVGEKVGDGAAGR